MKRIAAFRIICLLLLGLSSPFFLFATGEEATQIIEKTYPLTPVDIVEVINKYGKVTVSNWDKKYMEVKITIITKATTKEKAEARLQEVAIRERAFGQKVQFETRLDGTQIPLAGASGIKVNYEIHLPAANPLEIENKFGDIILDKREGNVDIDLSYGDFYAGELLGGGNTLHLQLGKADIRYFHGGDIDFSFGSLHIDQCDFLYLKSNASQIEINKVQNLELYANLGEIRVDEVGTISGNYTSSKFTIGKLNQSLDMDVKYAPRFEVREVSAEVEHINIDGNFSSFHIYLDPEAQMNLDATMENGDVLVADPNLKVDSVLVETNQTHYQSRSQDATARQARPAVQVNVQNKFGNLRVYRKDEE
ncbi:MAG: hypothetical protein SF052_24070 [Bacteroidia bacterium]|nr:hypothetical protein [Bacteroidia bacterium]